MLIILEGPDGAGKSTLVNTLSEIIDDDVEVMHRGVPRSHPLVEYEDPLLNYRPGLGRHVICDRWHIGEWVYPRVMGRRSDADLESWTHIELFLRARGAVTVPVMPTTQVLKDRLRVRGDDYVQERDVDGLVAGYREMFTKTLTLRASVDLPGVIVKNAEFAGKLAADVRHRGSYVGAVSPKVVLVGERRNFEEPYPPAFGPFRATSGHYLLGSIGNTFNMLGVGLMNAYEEDLADTWASLGHPLVVALGRRADVELRRANVPHGAVPHPQFVRRFHHKHKIWYGWLIHRAAYRQEDLLRCRP